jgi:hypothetical protein
MTGYTPTGYSSVTDSTQFSLAILKLSDFAADAMRHALHCSAGFRLIAAHRHIDIITASSESDYGQRVGFSRGHTNHK